MTISKDTLEQLSEFVDGQVERESGIFFAKRLSADDELQAVWSRYHLIRECVRHRGAHGQAVQLPSRVASAIAAEPKPGFAPLQMQPAWLRPVAGLAITAVVAVSAVIAVQNNTTQPGQTGEIPVAENQIAAFVTPEDNGLVPATNRAVPVSFQPTRSQNSQRLNAYILRHNQVAARIGRGGVIYLAPIVSAQNATASGQDEEHVEEGQPENPGTQVADKVKDQPESPTDQ